MVFNDLDGKGVNVGSVLDKEVYVPITILPTRTAQKDKYIKDLKFEKIFEIIIYDEKDNIIEYIKNERKT